MNPFMSSSDSQAPNFNLSRNLAATDRFQSITLLSTEPADSHKHDVRWRLYVFKDGKLVSSEETFYELHRQRFIFSGGKREWQTFLHSIRPAANSMLLCDPGEQKKIKYYLIDLGSTNRTFINGSAIEPQRYYELVEEDTIRFGNSSREYVLLHENSVADCLFLTRDGAKWQNYED